MADERITERTDGVTTERTIERDTGDRVVVERRGGGGSTILIVLLLAALAVGAYFLFQANERGEAETAAVAEAAESVGDAADDAGEAIKDAVN